MVLYIKVGSVTNAQRGQRLLRSKGYIPRIRKAENPEQTDGCGYAIEVQSADNTPVEILEHGRIEIRGVEER